HKAFWGLAVPECGVYGLAHSQFRSFGLGTQKNHYPSHTLRDNDSRFNCCPSSLSRCRSLPDRCVLRGLPPSGWGGCWGANTRDFRESFLCCGFNLSHLRVALILGLLQPLDCGCEFFNLFRHSGDCFILGVYNSRKCCNGSIVVAALFFQCVSAWAFVPRLQNCPLPIESK